MLFFKPLLIVAACLGLLLVHEGGYAKEAKTLVILGDSLSAGYGVEQGAGWVALMQGRIEKLGLPVKVINESISGEVTAGGLARLPSILQRIQPDMLVIELGGNDGLRGLSPTAMARNLSEMITLAKENGVEVYLFGMKLPPNYGKAYNQLFENAFQTVAQQHQVPLLPFFLEGVGGYEKLMQADRIHPNKTAQAQLLENAWAFLLPYLQRNLVSGEQVSRN